MPVPDMLGFHKLSLICIFGLYLGLSLYQLDLPGLHYDEAFEAVPAVQLLAGRPVTAFRNSGLQIGAQLFPFMTQDYIGAINTYLSIPFIWLFGSTATALRLTSVFTGLITLTLSYALAYRLTGQPWAGLTAASLLATDPTFIFWNRQGIFVTAITAPIALGATVCWLQRIQTGAVRWTLAGSFLLGLGLYAKILFLWIIFALIGALILLNLSDLLQQLRRPRTILAQLSWTEGAAALAAFALGSWPLIAYNIQTGGTVLSITQNAATSYYGVDNLAVSRNLAERLAQFISLLRDSHLWYLGAVIGNWWSVVVFLVTGVCSVYLSIRRPGGVSAPQPAAHKIALFPFTVIGLTILASIGTVSALWITHYAILMPWPALAIAVGSWFILKTLPHRTIVKVAVALSLSLLLITNLVNTVRYHTVLTKSGGLSTHSDAIYDLSHWLADHADGLVVAMDWGLAAPVTYLTNGQVTPTEVFGYAWQSDVQLEERLTYFMQQPEAFYVWRAPDEIIFDRSDEFKALYRPRHLEETIEEAFYERSGRPILGVTRLVEQGTATNPPQ